MQRINYFAYGSNMDKHYFIKRYSSAIFNGTARLDDYCFIINSKGVATLRKQAGSVVYGVMWKISESDEKLLDEFEGVENGLYKSVILPVWSERKKMFSEMKVYVSENIIPGFPLPGYMQIIIESAAVHQFPSDYIKYLQRQDEELFF